MAALQDPREVRMGPRDQGAMGGAEPCLVIRHQRGVPSGLLPARHQRMRKGGLARPRRADNQHPALAEAHCGRMDKRGSTRRYGAVGRRTVNRAPATSRLLMVVRYRFSAKISPLWASTICRLIANPKPELLPNDCCSCRSV